MEPELGEELRASARRSPIAAANCLGFLPFPSCIPEETSHHAGLDQEVPQRPRRDDPAAADAVDLQRAYVEGEMAAPALSGEFLLGGGNCDRARRSEREDGVDVGMVRQEIGDSVGAPLNVLAGDAPAEMPRG